MVLANALLFARELRRFIVGSWAILIGPRAIGIGPWAHAISACLGDAQCLLVREPLALAHRRMRLLPVWGEQRALIGCRNGLRGQKTPKPWVKYCPGEAV